MKGKKKKKKKNDNGTLKGAIIMRVYNNGFDRSPDNLISFAFMSPIMNVSES